MKQGEYRIDAVKARGLGEANGVYVDTDGAWLGSVVEQDEQLKVEPYRDENGQLIAAPEHWQCLIVRQLR